jgi:hypothetical protein
MRQLFFALILIIAASKIQAQVWLILPGGRGLVPQHGFLPGKAFKFYPTINKYDFSGLKMCVEIHDQRDSLKLVNLSCAKVAIDNTSEFAGAQGADKVGEYFENLLPQSNIKLDSTASDTLKVSLQALDARLIGFGSITAHGLCQMKIQFRNISQTYCVDITDKDPHSPISPTAFVTRKTATRVIASAGIREVIEQFFADLKTSLDKPAAGN